MKRGVEIFYSSGFERAYERLELVIKKKAERRNRTVIFLDVGDHDIYK